MWLAKKSLPNASSLRFSAMSSLRCFITLGFTLNSIIRYLLIFINGGINVINAVFGFFAYRD